MTAAGAALETSLTVEEAERVLSGLAAKGHLRIKARDGGLFYSFWQRDAPEKMANAIPRGPLPHLIHRSAIDYLPK